MWMWDWKLVDDAAFDFWNKKDEPDDGSEGEGDERGMDVGWKLGSDQKEAPAKTQVFVEFDSRDFSKPR